MSWGLAILLIVLFICFTALVFLQFPATPYLVETYFIVVVLVLFIILLFTVDFDNPVSTTIYIRTANAQNPLVYEVPYNSDDSYSNLISASFAGNWDAATTPVNNTPAADTVIFNYDSLAVNDTVSLLSGKIIITKLADWQLSVTVDPTVSTASNINGFLTLNLLCTGSQSINNKFKLIQS